MRRLGAVWLSNEGPGVIADIRADADSAAHNARGFVLSRGGVPLATIDPHGTWLDWTAQNR